jgi:predicted nucleic acid-binding protein
MAEGELDLERPHPNDRVVQWLGTQSALDLAISVLTLGDIQMGQMLLPLHRRKAALARWIDTDLPRQFSSRVLPVDDSVALEWARLSSEGRRRGRAGPAIDGLILATAAVHGLTLVTRNVADCAERGIPVLDPWTT